VIPQRSRPPAKPASAVLVLLLTLLTLAQSMPPIQAALPSGSTGATTPAKHTDCPQLAPAPT
jgi:hypothetical protein